WRRCPVPVVEVLEVSSLSARVGPPPAVPSPGWACWALPVAARPAPVLVLGVGCSVGLPHVAHAAPETGLVGGGGPPPSPTPPSRSPPTPDGYAEHYGPGGTTRAPNAPGYGPENSGTNAE